MKKLKVLLAIFVAIVGIGGFFVYNEYSKFLEEEEAMLRAQSRLMGVPYEEYKKAYLKADKEGISVREALNIIRDDEALEIIYKELNQ